MPSKFSIVIHVLYKAFCLLPITAFRLPFWSITNASEIQSLDRVLIKCNKIRSRNDKLTYVYKPLTRQVTAFNHNKNKWQQAKRLTAPKKHHFFDRKCFRRSFVSLTSGLNKINHSTARKLNCEGSRFSSTVKQTRPYFALICFDPSKFMAPEGSIAPMLNEILLGNRKSIAATIMKWVLWQQRGFNMLHTQ